MSSTPGAQEPPKSHQKEGASRAELEFRNKTTRSVLQLLDRLKDASDDVNLLLNFWESGISAYRATDWNAPNNFANISKQEATELRALSTYLWSKYSFLGSLVFFSVEGIRSNLDPTVNVQLIRQLGNLFQAYGGNSLPAFLKSQRKQEQTALLKEQTKWKHKFVNKMNALATATYRIKDENAADFKFDNLVVL